MCAPAACSHKPRWVSLSAVSFALVLCAQLGCQPAPTASAQERASRAAPSAYEPPEQVDRVVSPRVDTAEAEAPALRIVSAAPNVTEICCALGLREMLVARTKYCVHPPGIASVPSIGALVDVDLEFLLELKPDLILVSGASRAQSEKLASLGLRFETLPDTSLSDLFAAIRRVGALTGRARTAESLCREIHEQLDRAQARFRGGAPARVLLLTGVLSDPPRPPFVAGAGSFYEELLRLGGHANAIGGAAFAALSLEAIVEADPDVIIELDPAADRDARGDAAARRVWSALGPLRAVQTGRIRVLHGPQHYLLGPRIAQTAAALLSAVAEPTDG